MAYIEAMQSETITGQFFSPTRGSLDFNQVIKEIFDYISAGPEFLYDIVVGCDSPSTDKPFFPIAIVVLRKGQGGRFFLKKMHYPEPYLKRFRDIPNNWKQRILQEVYLSCELALELRETLEKEFGAAREGFNYQFVHIHADIGEHGKTKEMVREITGLIKGHGFEPMIKPLSFAASVVADRYT